MIDGDSSLYDIFGILMNKKIIIIILFLLIAGASAWFVYNKKSNQTIINPVSEYSDVVKQSASNPVSIVKLHESEPAAISLTIMLRSGIYTNQGVLQSESLTNAPSIEKNRLILNNKPTKIQAVSEIELVKAFELNHQQILLLSFNQGGNQCEIQYQMLTISESQSITSQVFGSCLPLTNIVESGNEIILSMPQNNPYLGNDVLVDYRYFNGQVNERLKLTKQQLKQKYANLDASKILQIATKDGCYVDGIMLDDNSCGNGRKYCVMFKNLTRPVKTDDYKFLKDFCSN